MSRWDCGLNAPAARVEGRGNSHKSQVAASAFLPSPEPFPAGVPDAPRGRDSGKCLRRAMPASARRPIFALPPATAAMQAAPLTMLPPNVHHLELFFYVAKFGGITPAVRKMPYGIQQPAVSGQMLQLERSLGVKLFNRRPFA